MLLGELPELEETVAGKELIQIGEQRGEQRGERKLVLRQLRKRLGDLDPLVEVRVESLSADHLEQAWRGPARFQFPCRPGCMAETASVREVSGER